MIEKYLEEAGYYHARVADMMAKAQCAPSKATRVAYLNLARAWARRAATLEKEGVRGQTADPADGAEGAPPEEKKPPLHLDRGNF